MESRIFWEETKELMQARLENALLKGKAPINKVDMTPQGNRPCFYSSRMLEGLKTENMVLRDIPECLGYLTQEGKDQEQLSSNYELVKVVQSFKEGIEAYFGSFIGQITKIIYSSLSLIFFKGSDIVELFEKFNDGLLNGDSELMNEIEKVLKRVSATSWNSHEGDNPWKPNQAKIALENSKNAMMELCGDLERGIENIFKTFQKPCSVEEIQKVKKLEKGGFFMNNLAESEITPGNGLQCRKESSMCFSLSSTGSIHCASVENEKQYYSLDVDGSPHNGMKLSPNGLILAIALSNKKEIQFFNAQSGFLLKSIAFQSESASYSAVWLNNDLFCLGFGDGAVRVFSFLFGVCKGKFKMGSVVISALENFDGETIFAMNQSGTVFLFNLRSNCMVWTKAGMHSGCACLQKFGLKKSHDSKRLATTGDCDQTLKVTRICDKQCLGQKTISGRCWELEWISGDQYIVVMTKNPNKVVLVSGAAVTILHEFDLGPDIRTNSMAVHTTCGFVVVGDTQGRVHKLKMIPF